MSRPTIWEYREYRRYLRDVYFTAKGERKDLSFESAARKLGTTRAYLQLILKEKRHPSLEQLFPIACYLHLDPIEKRYLLYLYLENTTRELEAKSYFRSMLARLKDQYGPSSRSSAPAHK